MNPENNTQPGSSTTLPTQNNTEQALNAVLQQLNSQSGIISSTPSRIESTIQSAISGIRQSNASSQAAIQSRFEREAQGLLELGNETMIEGRSQGAGGVMNMAALRKITETTDKNLKDLAMRKEELILQGNAQAASQIAGLEIEALRERQKAEQAVFQNLLAMAGLNLQVAQEQRLDRAQTFQERTQISSIALEYGIDVRDGDTIETIVARAAPLASQEQRARLNKLLSETRYNNARINELSRGTTQMTKEDIEIIAQAAAINPIILETIKDPRALAQATLRTDAIINEDLVNTGIQRIAQERQAGRSDAVIRREILSKNDPAEVKNRLLEELNKTAVVRPTTRERVESFAKTTPRGSAGTNTQAAIDRLLSSIRR